MRVRGYPCGVPKIRLSRKGIRSMSHFSTTVEKWLAHFNAEPKTLSLLSFRRFQRLLQRSQLSLGTGSGLLSHLHRAIQDRAFLELHPAGHHLSIDLAGGLELQTGFGGEGTPNPA